VQAHWVAQKKRITNQCSAIEPYGTFLAVESLRSANQFIAL
jgi:hypothetical protein